MGQTLANTNINTNNIVGFNNGSVYSVVQSFLQQNKMESENTYRNYKCWINEFFSYTFPKDITLISWEELENLTHTQYVVPFVNYLVKTKGNSRNTVSSKINSVKALFDVMAKDNPRIRPAIFTKIKGLNRNKIENEVTHYDHFTETEMNNLIEYAKTEDYRGLVKSVAIEVLFHTALRAKAVLNMTWNNIKQKYDSDSGLNLWCIKTKDKGNKYDEIFISNSLYEKIHSLKEYYTESENYTVTKEDRVFNIDYETLGNVIKRFIKKENIDPTRKLSIHSIKGSSGDRAFILAQNDVKKLQKHMHHESITTTLKNYKTDKINPTEQIAFRFDATPDVEKLNELSKEELIEAIKSCGDGIALQVLIKAGKFN